MLSRTTYHILRVGLAITFIWVGVLILRSPESWAGLVQPWVTEFLPAPISQIMISNAILDIIIGIIFLIDWKTWIAGVLACLHLIIVLAVTGITDITVRDIGLLAAALVVLLESLPLSIKNLLIKH